MNFERTLLRPAHRFSRCGTRTRDTPTRSSYRCCCWCFSSVLLLLWFGHTHAAKPVLHTSGRGYSWCVEGHSKLRRPCHLRVPSDSDKAQTPRSTTSQILQRVFTATPARCWAGFFGVDCPSVRDAQAVSFCLARATSRRVSIFLLCLGKRLDHSGRHRQSLMFFSTKFLQNSCLSGRTWPNFKAF